MDQDTLISLSSAGSLQDQRKLPAQAAAHFSVEERNSSDWLRQWQDLAERLRFYAPSGSMAGTWAALLPPQDDWPALAAWLDHGTALPPLLKQRIARPDLALLLAFLKLQRHPRAAFAALTEQHRQHYYRQILHLAPKPGTPDEADLLLTLAEGAERTVLPSGSVFSAGLDQQEKELLYRSLDPLPLSAARLSRVITLGQSHDNEGKAQLLQRHCLNEATGIKWPAAACAVFGSNLADASNTLFAPGFRLVSPLLWLSAGQRSINIIFYGNDARSWISNLGNFATTKELSNAFNQCWQVSASTAQGEMVLGAASVSKDIAQDDAHKNQEKLTISWQIDESATAIGAAEQATPWLAFHLRTKSGIASLPSWQTLQLNDVELVTECDGLTPDAVRSNSSVADISAPFDAFPGPISAGHRLTVAHKECLLKPISSLRLALQWEGRPASLNTHYKIYRDYLNTTEPPVAEAWPQPSVQLAQSISSPYQDKNKAITPFLGADKETFSFSLEKKSASTDLAALPQALPADPLEWPLWFALEYGGDPLGHQIEREASAWLASRFTSEMLSWSQHPHPPKAKLLSISASISQNDNIPQNALKHDQKFWNGLPSPAPEASTIQWLQLSYDQSFTPSVFELVVKANSEKEYSLGKNPKLEGSTDGTHWVTLQALTAAIFIFDQKNKTALCTLPLPSLSSYSHYRVSAESESALIIDYMHLEDGHATPPQLQILPAPYTPRLSKLTLGYSSRASLRENNIQLWQAHPIGLIRQVASEKPAEPLSPIANWGKDSCLFIGIENLPGSGVLALRPDILAQNAADNSPAARWFCLTPQRWEELQSSKQGQAEELASILSDQSNGLHNSGIVRLSLPALWKDEQGLSWLAVRQAPASAAPFSPPQFALLRDIGLHAVRVRYQGQNDQHLGHALAAGLISQQQPPHPAVASITQPAMSQDGLPGESDETFAVRAAERLAHKGRALTARDYEKLVLDLFPGVAMVKAIRQPLAGKTRSGVRLIVAPRPERADLLQPLPSRKLQADILAKIKTIMPPDTQLNISAPSYLVYRLNCNLVLNPDYEAGATLQKLNQRLIQFLSPWANTQRLGARLYLSEASNFLAAQTEISHVVAIRGETSQDGTHWLTSPKPWLETQSNMEILVPASQHLFQQLAHADEVFEGLSTTALEFDFQVYPDLSPTSFPLTGIGQSRVGINLAIS
jgi:hypothetical protein